MKYILILLVIFSVSLTAKESRITKQEDFALHKAMEDEKKFAKEQKFYQANEYDLKSMEVDSSTVKNLGNKSLGEAIDAANEDFDMDDVY